jgi:transcriptional regulator with XRE-family HTH domain
MIQDYPETTVGQRVQAERERLGLSPEIAGVLAGVEKQAITRMERDEFLPSGKALAAFSNIGFDILFITTGKRHDQQIVTPLEMAEGGIRKVLSFLPELDRIRLLTMLLREEMGA